MSEIRFNKVLVGVDFSPAESALLSCLPELKRWGTDTLVMAHMVPVGYTSISGYGHEADYLKDLEKTAEPLRQAGLTVETLVRDSTHPAKAFAALAGEMDANMILVGSRSHNFLHKLFLGSFATEVLQHSRVPVLIERIEKSAQQTAEACEAVCRQNLDKVLLATDLSREVIEAEQTAIALSEHAGQLNLLTVLNKEFSAEAAKDHLEALKNRLVQRGNTTEILMAAGTPSEVIISEARNDYTLIILGKHGNGRRTETLIGSTAETVCRDAQRPVLVVPSTT
ncbi:UspA domain-containing protein [Marinobacter santoriniensis NKSG1]|uniref:UspA domain-containing protein n=1 Tax=Marinobacter santoriniensis NKSG1 TaxID=1288826 RepID=M7DGU3_9GAMM|nr:universal stress protein [Marinobacter santoriniensis]EMP56892.1 UspA domain-containing protein [Marinobacter santoriniensis NKSG1]|tara:strand:+ start:84 stop:929 length:846 start_codon:yes stop_codon:yes gene_type:complete